MKSTTHTVRTPATTESEDSFPGEVWRGPVCLSVSRTAVGVVVLRDGNPVAGKCERGEWTTLLNGKDDAERAEVFAAWGLAMAEQVGERTIAEARESAPVRPGVRLIREEDMSATEREAFFAAHGGYA